jgi:hypothetical protein
VVLDAMTNATYRLRWPAGPDAEAIAAHLGDVSLDELVALGDDVSDDDYDAWFPRTRASSCRPARRGPSALRLRRGPGQLIQ